MTTPGYKGEEHGGHAWATGLLESLGVGPSRKEIEPPFPSPHGWQVEIHIPPQAAKNGNGDGAWLNVYLPKGSLGRVR